MSAFVVTVAFVLQVDVALSIRAGAESYSNMTIPDCATWYKDLPGKMKAKMGWTSSERKDYLSESPDPCAAVGLECCQGKCGLKGCEKELDCRGCKAKLTGLEADVQKAICEDSQICSNEWVGHCIFLPTGCTRKKQSCDSCTMSYSESADEVAKAACENPELCYLPSIGTYKEGGCNWNGASKRCERGASEIHDHYKPMFESN